MKRRIKIILLVCVGIVGIVLLAIPPIKEFATYVEERRLEKERQEQFEQIKQAHRKLIMIMYDDCMIKKEFAIRYAMAETFGLDDIWYIDNLEFMESVEIFGQLVKRTRKELRDICFNMREGLLSGIDIINDPSRYDLTDRSIIIMYEKYVWGKLGVDTTKIKNQIGVKAWSEIRGFNPTTN
ncbi:MAG: hypothetical protein OXC61_04025 [Flavobacteriaceae bacterium]|nr:hypothetical protein [Flavobacteriaceae bacterium]